MRNQYKEMWRKYVELQEQCKEIRDQYIEM